MKIHVNDNDLGVIRTRFEQYVATFKEAEASHQANISLKREHSLRVCDNILLIGRALGLEDGELRLAEIIALLHDIGRFEQYAQYRTFMDSKSVNHAELGIHIIEKIEILAGMETDLKEMIIRPILYHNRAALPAKETQTCLFFSQLIRDADKLDIWNVTTNYYLQSHGKKNTVIELGLDNREDLSPAVINDLLHHRIVDIKNLNTLNDFKLLQVSWVFDLNFVPTVEETMKRGYLQKLRSVLPDSKKIEEIFAMATDHMHKRIGKEQKGQAFA
ncbi:HD domain-containing protein [Desulfogranum marinum]|uniref:HD domain-containing protein n=1 Tax=Desulfogranum marinum TaxID=453220 RepID=UPI0019639A37|nr:HD domain-containing protein [Desulfogranum marinum]MBM9514913.1 HD domain-containing protein [Desulfogranum marinum]